MTVKLAFTASLLDAQHYRGSVKNNRQVHLLCRWEKHLAGIIHLGVVDRWLETPKRASIAHCSFSRDRRTNMQIQKNNKCYQPK